MIPRIARAWRPALILSLASSLVQGQGATARAPKPSPPDSVALSVLTFGPGEELFDRFGHMAIRVRDARRGVDTAYNWGMYSFDEPHFIWRFMTGDTRYWMQGFPTDLFVNAYRRVGRAVWEQDLALTIAEADTLARAIAWNARDENKYYRYDYFVDNCSTRLRDALDHALHGALRPALQARSTSVTYREETLRLAADFPVIDLGMSYVLGPRTDAPLSAWDAAFIPMRLREALDSVTLTAADGSKRPLVSARRVLVPETSYREPSSVPRLALLGISLSVAIAGLSLALAVGARRSSAARLLFITVTSGWHFVIGLAGLLLLFAGLFTRHVFMGGNVNVMLGTPASLALAVLIPFALRPGASGGRIRAMHALAAVAAACAAVALVLRALPIPSPDNWPALALALPAHLGTVLALRRATAASSPAA